MKGHMTKL